MDGLSSQEMMDVIADKETMSGQDCTQTNILQNARPAINQLPVELLVAIISMAKDYWETNPYTCILFSGVCRHWRSVVLGTAAFWKTIVMNGRMTPDFLQELLRRSQTTPLEIVVKKHVLPFPANIIWDSFAAVADRVKTLNFDTPDYVLCFRDATSFFPSLENLFYRFPLPDLSFHIPRMHPHLTALRISIGRLEGLAMPGRFPELRWLQLGYELSIPWDPLLKALQSLPNLQVLRIYPLDDFYSRTVIEHPIITLPELKVLITYDDQIIQLIDAPKLIYFHAENYPTRYDNGPFCGFNFRRITRVNLTIGDLSSFYISGYSPGARFSFYHENVNPIFDPIPTSYSNGFKILLEDLTRFDDEDTSTGGPETSLPVFAACLKKTINLVELRLSGDDPPWRFWNRDELNSLFKTLKCATSVRVLIIHWGLSFATLCDILSDGTIFPYLEKIVYFNDEENSQDLSDLHSPQMLMKERFTKDRKPLEIDLQDFPPVHPELLEEIGRLGIRLTQAKK
ncbi:hypothetical protein Clacol_000124 [Clathrus columnatus]|uniref:F-box domain-containing protein n=1 Tax=Clathrus columnatus TaxID=1419009 RepID=A0AAV4ZY31_9AGAM|nr:hypothetical protein Clacol_000124 [Clathrus columnatus]